jgi:hypothetical protein
MAGDVAAVRGWITGRICEARWLADEARAAACDIEDRAVFDATIQLAIDLEMFAAKLADRLTEADESRGIARAPRPRLT